MVHKHQKKSSPKGKGWMILVLLVLFVVSTLFLKNKLSYEKVGNPFSSDSSVVKKNKQKESVETSNVPTLYIHGYSGTYYSFGPLIKRLEKENVTKKELTLTVDSEGNISAKGQLSGEPTNPSIQIIFEDNISHEWNQAEWIRQSLKYLYENYQVKEVNLVGHSMGGVSALRYLVTFGQETGLPKVTKFVAIASPFNNFAGISEGENIETVMQNGPVIQSDRYLDYVNGIGNMPIDIACLIISGDIEDGSQSDGTVQVLDALSVVSLLRAHGNNVEYQEFFGKQAQHSKLHENLEVDQALIKFLYEN